MTDKTGGPGRDDVALPNGRFTPTQERILATLDDGNPHPAAELRSCLDDELAGNTALHFHVSVIRKKIRPAGQDIATHRVGRVTYYALVRLVGSPYRG